MSAPDCTCGHPQSKHKSLKLGCRGCDIGCARFEPETPAEPVVEPVPADELAAVADAADELDLAKPDPGAPVEGLAALADLREVERERDRLLENERRWAAEVEQVERARDEAREQRDDARTYLARVDIAAGRDIAKPDEPLVDRVADLLRGRTEADERALRLAAELSEANGRIRELACEVEQHVAEIERLRASADGYLLAGTDGMGLLDQADATGVPAITGTSDTIRDLIGQLREQLAEHERLEGLRAEAARLEEQLAEIRRQLAEAEKPPAPTVPDKTIRDWARKNGFEVDGRGRVPLWLRGKYLQANPTTEGAPTA